MGEIILEIMSDEYREEYREKYRELIGIFGEFSILFCEFLYEMYTCCPARGHTSFIHPASPTGATKQVQLTP